MLAPDQNYGEAREMVPAPIEDALLKPGNAGNVVIGSMVLAVCLVSQWRKRGYDPRWSLPLAIVAIDVVMLWVIWHGAPGEAARHALADAVSLRIALLFVTALLVDRWLEARRASVLDGAARHPDGGHAAAR